MSVPINHTTLPDRAWVKFCRVYENIEARCSNPPMRKQEEPYYGLEFWPTFKAYEQAMLESFNQAYAKDQDCSIDRLKNTEGYTTDNCRWASKLQQQFNKSNSNRFLAISPVNEAFIVNSGNAFAEAYDLAYSEISRIINGKFRSAVSIPHHKNWRFFMISPEYYEFFQLDEPFISIGVPFLTPEAYHKFLDYQRKLGYGVEYPSIRDQMHHVSQNCLSLIVETGELLREIPHKPWRPIEDQPHNKAKALEELIDMFFFVINTGIAMGWEYPEIVLAQSFKMEKNLSRISSGYNSLAE
jgi:hypothetical protein